MKPTMTGQCDALLDLADPYLDTQLAGRLAPWILPALDEPQVAERLQDIRDLADMARRLETGDLHPGVRTDRHGDEDDDRWRTRAICLVRTALQAAVTQAALADRHAAWPTPAGAVR